MNQILQILRLYLRNQDTRSFNIIDANEKNSFIYLKGKFKFYPLISTVH